MTSPDRLYKRWVHSHEEDRDDAAVFRPATFDLPPARGRRSIELRDDGSYVEAFPGPTDAPQEAGGRWSLEGDRLALEPNGDQPAETWRIVAVEEDRLELRRL